MQTIRIALTGEYNDGYVAHRAIPRALALAAAAIGCRVEARWVPTTELLPEPGSVLQSFDAHWCVPGSPYASTEGALAGIADSRRRRRPFLGTCGGFQHAVLELARNAAGIADAAHAESDPAAPTLVVTPLACALLETMGHIILAPGCRVARAYGRYHVVEGFNCSYGLNQEFRAQLVRAGMTISGVDELGNVRAIELPGHPFFVGTLFQPERSALAGPVAHPLVAAFVEAARARAAGAAAAEAGPASAEAVVTA